MHSWRAPIRGSMVNGVRRWRALRQRAPSFMNEVARRLTNDWKDNVKVLRTCARIIQHISPNILRRSSLAAQRRSTRFPAHRGPDFPPRMMRCLGAPRLGLGSQISTFVYICYNQTTFFLPPLRRLPPLPSGLFWLALASRRYSRPSYNPSRSPFAPDTPGYSILRLADRPGIVTAARRRRSGLRADSCFPPRSEIGSYVYPLPSAPVKFVLEPPYGPNAPGTLAGISAHFPMTIPRSPTLGNTATGFFCPLPPIPGLPTPNPSGPPSLHPRHVHPPSPPASASSMGFRRPPCLRGKSAPILPDPPTSLVSKREFGTPVWAGNLHALLIKGVKTSVHRGVTGQAVSGTSRDLRPGYAGFARWLSSGTGWLSSCVVEDAEHTITLFSRPLEQACTKARMKTTSFLSIPNLFKGQRETRIRESTLSSEWYSTPMTAESQWDTSYLMPNKASLRERMTLPASGLSSTGGFTAHRESISPTGEHQPYERQSQLKLSFGPPEDLSGFTVEPLECNSDQRIKMSAGANDAPEFRLK
ncbi:hypothetical protein C8F04DRAFT_1197578 [Mycena alexandri]|uniref:Uncharacterized protein n=1 Tax=Mycena alexandri TaxID=1745969 RepID=A0AAD6WM93_9AGAR|nr:hypothetical protein C8F04DRAFT_1197578 [Mycena alexandri]